MPDPAQRDVVRVCRSVWRVPRVSLFLHDLDRAFKRIYDCDPNAVAAAASASGAETLAYAKKPRHEARRKFDD